MRSSISSARGARVTHPLRQTHRSADGTSALPYRRRAFSLLELLVVMGIMGLVLVMTLPALNSTREGLDVTRGTDIVVDSLNLARQQAMSLNRPVVVRFYNSAAEEDGADGFSRLQLFVLQDDGTLEASTKMQRLPDRVLISGAAGMSNFLTNAPTTPSPAFPAETGLLASELTIRRDGSADLTPGQSSYLTVVPRRQRDKSDPDNFGIVTIEPSNTTIAQIRP